MPCGGGVSATGLPLVLAGEKGTGKRLLAGKTWEYCKGKQVVPAESRFAELDCTMWGAAEPGGTGFAASFKRKLEAGTAAIFVPARLDLAWRACAGRGCALLNGS